MGRQNGFEVLWKHIYHMQQSHIKPQSHTEPSARKLRVTKSVSECDVNNDRILHWLSFYMRSASLNNKPNGLQIRAPIIYLMDHWRLTLQAPVLELQMLGLYTYRKNPGLFLSFKVQKRFSKKGGVGSCDD